MNSHKLTQAFSTWGGKLLQHTDRLAELQKGRMIRPITVQIAPTEACDSRCSFCSVGERPSGRISFDLVQRGLSDFAKLGALSVEITGGGNPLLYRDGERSVDDVAKCALDLGLKVGVITNTENLSARLSPSLPISWVRVSLAKLDEGLKATDFDFSGFEDRLGLSYIIHEGTTPSTIREIAKVVEIWPSAKFVRIAPDCTTEDSRTIEEKWGWLVDEIDQHGKFFIKEIGGNFHPHPGGCWVGGIRPYWTSTGIYICSSHVLKTRKYEPEWRLCGADEIPQTWAGMSRRLQEGKLPYDIDLGKCWHCYYANNNELLDYVVNPLPDKDFA